MPHRQTFLLIGQSNMAGRDELNRVPSIDDDRIQMFRNGRWQKQLNRYMMIAPIWREPAWL